MFGVTTVVGPLLGGYFTDHWSWRWAFWVNVPIALVVLIVSVVTMPALSRAGRPVIDYPGIVLIGLGATGLTLATSWGGTTYPWASPAIIGLFVISALALAIFVWVELRVAEPVLPIRLFASPVFTVCCVLSFVVGFAMLGALTFLPTFMQFVDGVSATESGIRTLPMVAGLLMTSMGSGALVGRTGRYKIFPVLGTAIMAVAFVLLSQMTAATPVWRQSLDLFVLGAGIGLCMQVLIMTVQNTVDFSDLGVATSGVTFFRTIGSSFGAAIFGSLFANFLGSRIGPALAASGAPAEAAQSPQVLHRLPPRPPLRSSRPTPTRWAMCSSTPRRWPWSDSFSRFCSRRCRCVRSTVPRWIWGGIRDAVSGDPRGDPGDRGRQDDARFGGSAAAFHGGPARVRTGFGSTVGVAAGLPEQAGVRIGPIERYR